MIPKKLPKFLHQYFWDVDATKLNPAKYPKYVINRLLDKGNSQAVKWVRQNFPESLIVKTIKQIRDFSERTARFLAFFYHIPEKEITCLNEPYLSWRRTHWPY